MIYLDYSATTKISEDVLDTFNKTSNEYFGNANSLNLLGEKSDDLIKKATKQIADILGCVSEDITYTSSATESNNMAIIGTVMANHKVGKHIITSKLEHPSVYAICDYLESIGFKISYVKNNDEGLIDFDDLKKLMTKETILVSICAVNSELGIRQPLKMIKQIIKKENANTYLHSDMTQAIGKVLINTTDVDLASASSHKIYGPCGIGLLYKAKNVKINPLMYGSGKINELKKGTPATALIASFSKALRLSQIDIEKRISYVEKINEKISYELSKIDGIVLNKTKYSIPQILNISFDNVKSETFVRVMADKDIYLSTNTACSSGELSNSVLAVYGDKKRASSTIRISLSHITSLDEVNKFIKIFNEEYNKLNKLLDK